MTKISRRQFLRVLAAGGVSISAFLAYKLLPGTTPQQNPAGNRTIAAATDIDNSSTLLLIDSPTNPFGSYLGEVLRAEGLNLFETSHLDKLNEDILQKASLVLLAEGPVEEKQVRLLKSYVEQGGRLVAMRPDPRLSSIFGIEYEAGTTAEGYIRISPEQPLAGDLAPETLQFHGEADHYRLAGARAIAWLHSDAATGTGRPAVTLHRFGQGWAAMWAFDLARSIAYTRQGNPAWANQERDGFDGIRAQEAFFGWVDLARIAVPQADQHMRLLTAVITEMLAGVTPLPRLWYFPDSSPALLIATGDSHGNPVRNIEALLSIVEDYGGTMSIYYTPRPRSDNLLRRSAGLAAQQVKNWLDPFPNDLELPPTPAQVQAWRARGHEFSLHPYVEEGVAQGYQAYVDAFEAEGYELQPTKTVRTHRVLWHGWVETAKVQASQGFGMNVDFYHMGSLIKTEDGRWARGYFTGSGLPMRMVDETGQIIDVYQLLTELVDEQLLQGVNSGFEELTAEAATTVSREMIDNALQYHTALTTQFHLDFYHPTSSVHEQVAQWAEGTLAYAVEKGLPVWDAARYLDFVRRRDETRFQELTWDETAGQLTFGLLSAAGTGADLTVLIPATFQRVPGEAPTTGQISRVEIDGQPVPFSIGPAPGGVYAWISVVPGQHRIDAWLE